MEYVFRHHGGSIGADHHHRTVLEPIHYGFADLVDNGFVLDHDRGSLNVNDDDDGPDDVSVFLHLYKQHEHSHSEHRLACACYDDVYVFDHGGIYAYHDACSGACADDVYVFHYGDIYVHHDACPGTCADDVYVLHDYRYINVRDGVNDGIVSCTNDRLSGDFQGPL